MNWPENFITRLFSLSVARELELEMNWLENFITRLSSLPVAKELDLDIVIALSLPPRFEMQQYSRKESV